MKVFLSWSGASSHHIAKCFEAWLPRFLQAVEPWISSHMAKGTVWDNEISKELNDTKAGIFCITPDNLDSPYLHYEAGAISNVPGARLFTFLFKVEPIDVKQPLSRFQSTKFEESDVLVLMQSINEKLRLANETNLADSDLEKNFALFWPLLKKELDKTPEPSQPKPIRSPEDILEEVLRTVRGLQPLQSNVISPVSAHGDPLPYRLLVRQVRNLITEDNLSRDEALNEKGNIAKKISRLYPQNVIMLEDTIKAIDRIFLQKETEN